MKFSVLLPTRNRLELLAYAIETVRRQNYHDWEIIVSDNASEQDVEGYIASLAEPRIKYVRTPSFVPVTENWNNALRNSTGDYVIMLGDDDCLLKGFFQTTLALIEKFDSPDCIYTNALLYAYPGVMPEHPDGFLQPYGYAPFLKNLKRPSLLQSKTARFLARQSMNFKMLYTYNMQHSVVSRAFIDSLSPKGEFFQSPYPDFYATNVIFMKARSIVVNPVPLVTVGISPKSFGYYYFNDQEKVGIEFLNNLPDAETARRMDDVILPGLYDKTAWLVAMEAIRLNYGSESCLRVGYNRYRYLQIIYVYGRYINAIRHEKHKIEACRREMDALKEKLALWEKVVYLNSLRLAAVGVLIIPKSLRGKLHGALLALIVKTPQLDLDKREERYDNILEVYERVDPKHTR